MTIGENINSFVDGLYANPYFMSVLKISLVLYAARIAPKLSDNVYQLLDNTFVKILAIFLMLHAAERRDFQLSLLIAFVYVVTINLLSGRRFMESFSDYNPEYKDTMKYIDYVSHIHPGCQKVTIADLEKSFGGDKETVQKTLLFVYRELMGKLKDQSEKNRIMTIAKALGLPYSIEYNDKNAPLIATILMYYGASITDTCSPPSS